MSIIGYPLDEFDKHVKRRLKKLLIYPLEKQKKGFNF